MTSRFKAMTGLDVDGDGVSGEAPPAPPAPPTYTILSDTYSTLKTAWISGKNYKLVSSLEELAETIATKVVAVTAKTDLASLDSKLTPALAKGDLSVSPMVENTLKFGQERTKQFKPLITVVKVSVPYNTAAAVANYSYEVAYKQVETIEKAMRIDNPEVTQ